MERQRLTRGFATLRLLFAVFLRFTTSRYAVYRLFHLHAGVTTPSPKIYLRSQRSSAFKKRNLQGQSFFLKDEISAWPRDGKSLSCLRCPSWLPRVAFFSLRDVPHDVLIVAV